MKPLTNNNKVSSKIGEYPRDRLAIESIHSRLCMKERILRTSLMEYVLEHKKPCKLEEIDQNINIAKTDLDEVMEGLLDKKAIVVDDEKKVNFIYPVSAFPTQHRVTLKDGRCLYAMCAIDAMGVAFTFQQDITIESQCSECGEKISLEIASGKIVKVLPEDTHVLHVDLNRIENWSGSC